ncbi:MAG: MFS transporter [Bacteroidales bacterium]|nr:MFS transporter [Bacteroidales bacterium]
MGSTFAPTRARYVVLAFLCGLTFILYLDRICIGTAAPAMAKELNLSAQQMGWIFWAFTLSYGLFEIPTGHWGDRYGTRRVLTRIALWWSLFTALTGAGSGFIMLLVVRFLFGAGEAGALPNVARVTGTWFPETSRGWVRGLVMMPALLGAMVAPVLSQWLMDVTNWRWVFVLYGLTGLGWSLAFWFWFRDRPADHPSVNAAERELIGPPAPVAPHGLPPMRLILSNPNLWFLSIAMIAGAAPMYLLFHWFPTILQDRGVSPEQTGWLTSLVMFGGAAGSILGGFAADWAVRRFAGTRFTRSVVGASGFGLAAVAMGGGVLLKQEVIVMSVCFAITAFGVHCHGSAWWGAAQDIGGKYVGSMFATGNMIGVFGAGAAILGFGYVPIASRPIAFAATAGLLAVGAVLWALVDTRYPLVVEKDHEKHPPENPAGAVV